MAWTDKGFVNISFGYQAGSRDLATTSSYPQYEETATVSTSQEVSGGGLFDINGGYKIWRNLAVGLGYSHVGSKSDAAITGSIPDPAVFDRPRTVTATATDLEHSENTINIIATWMLPVTDKVDVGFSFGPSFIMVSQDLVDSVAITEPGPTVTGTTIRTEEKTAGGINLGIDVTYLLNKRFGVGGLMRYTYGSVELNGATDKLTVGGFQIGAGGRIRF
jgi:hypothetical protein